MDIYIFVISVLAIFAFLFIVTGIHGAVLKRKRIAAFRRDYGKMPDVSYDDGDFEQIAEFYLYSLEHGGGEFKIDEITWNDLNMDGVFVDMNAAQTSCGEQVLYNTLRSPVFDKNTFDKRNKIIEALDADEALRIKLQLAFSKLGRRRRINICEEFDEQKRGIGTAIIYCVLSALFIAFLVCTVISPVRGAPFLLLSFIVNIIVYTTKMRKAEDDILRLNYALAMISTAKKVEKLAAPEIADYIAPLSKANKIIGGLSKIGGMSMKSVTNDLTDLFYMVLLWNLVSYEISKCKIGAHNKELMTIFEIIGGLDSAISIASYRRRFKVKCQPEIDFESKEAFLEARGLVHPLIENAMPNDFVTHQSVLLTGSNASGKSTYLKTVALNAVLAQTIGFCLSQRYRASAMRVYSSMALRDDLASGESYYIVEIKSIGRIIEAADSGAPVICIVDEVLRGTNTVERIAASSEILRHIASKGALCVAATHDIELASILSAEFSNYHFQEYIEDGSMKFDYKLKEGASTSRNAIKLLDIMGYDKSISEAAAEKAEHFLKYGKWGNV
jgi:hypothetical protein